MRGNIIYFPYINAIGGVETFLYEISKKYGKDCDITILYKEANLAQLNRLQKHCKVEKLPNHRIKCHKLFLNYDISCIDNIDADEYIEIIHADYVTQNLEPHTHPKINKYIGVSKRVCEAFTQLTGIECELCYNPMTPERPKRILHLLSATRLSPEKGRDRMLKLIDLLDSAEVPFVWTIFTDDTDVINHPNVVYRKPTLSVRDYIADADYVVQLSDCEGYSYTVRESLSLGTPVIVTPCPCFTEMGVNNSNSIIVPFDMQDIDIQMIYNSTFDFEWVDNSDIYDQLLFKGPHKGEEYYLVEATDMYSKTGYIDPELKCSPNEGQQWITSQSMIDLLTNTTLFARPMIKVICKITDELLFQ